jgi:hypothetical protein
LPLYRSQRAGKGSGFRPAATALLGELLLDGRKVDPGALAADQAILEIEDVQESSLDRPPTAIETEWMTDRRRMAD